MGRGAGVPSAAGRGCSPQPATHPSPFAAASWPRSAGQPITPGTHGLAAKEEQGREQLPPPRGPVLLNPWPSWGHGIAPLDPHRDPVVLTPPCPTPMAVPYPSALMLCCSGAIPAHEAPQKNPVPDAA